jgi:hypothetical protein
MKIRKLIFALSLTAAAILLPVSASVAQSPTGNNVTQDGVVFLNVPKGFRPATLAELKQSKNDCASVSKDKDQCAKCEWMEEAAINAIREAQKKGKPVINFRVVPLSGLTK